MSGYVPIYRKITQRERYTDVPTKTLFIHLLLTANHKAGKWRGETIKKGQLITGRKELSKQTGLSEQQIRTSISKLKSTSEITIKSTNKFSLITLCNWGTYDIKNKKQPATQPTNNQQVTTNNNNKEEIRNKEEYPFYFSDKTEKKIQDFVEDRKERKEQMTKRAKIMFRNKLKPYKEDYILELIEEAILGGWKTVYPKDETRTIYKDIFDEYKSVLDDTDDDDKDGIMPSFVEKYGIETMDGVKKWRRALLANQK